MKSAWNRGWIMGLILLVAMTVAACGANGEEEVTEPVPVEEAEEADPSAEPDEVTGMTDDVSGLESELEGRQRLVSGMPDDIPLPGGDLQQSTSQERSDDVMRYIAYITNPAPIEIEAAMDWYQEKLEGAGFEIVDWAVDETFTVGNGRGGGFYEARLDSVDEQDREVSVSFGGDDPGIRIWIEVDVP